MCVSDKKTIDARCVKEHSHSASTFSGASDRAKGVSPALAGVTLHFSQEKRGLVTVSACNELTVRLCSYVEPWLKT